MSETKDMVSGICVENYEVILVENLDPRKPKGFLGLPGGIIEQGETPFSALTREWREEVDEEEIFESTYQPHP
jgi:8-oxo-dGTP pyrophosphatase MutT (NUDIX family)